MIIEEHVRAAEHHLVMACVLAETLKQREQARAGRAPIRIDNLLNGIAELIVILRGKVQAI